MSSNTTLRRLFPWLLNGSAVRAVVPVRGLPAEGPVYLEDILTERPGLLLGGAHYLIIAMFVSLIVVASLVRVDVIVAAPGRLAADTPPMVIQPMELSVIREIRVKPGDVVNKGDILATLDPTFTQADTSTLTSQRNALQADIGRLEAEINNTPYFATAHLPEDVLQQDLYLQRQLQYVARLRQFDEDTQRYRDNITASEQNLVSLRKQLEVVKQVEAMRADLYQRQVGSKLSYLDAQASRMHAERDDEDMNAHLAELRHFLQSTEVGRQVFMKEWHRQQLEDLSKAREEFGKVSSNLAKAKRLDDMVVLTAPANGIVLEIAKRSVGSVLNAAETLITMVPTDSPLIADVMINSADVGYTKPGDEAMIKVDAFPYTMHGMLTGRLRSIGEDSTTPNGSGGDLSSVGLGSGIFHRSRIELTNTNLTSMPPGTHLFPGMSVTAEVNVGSRSVISYFLNPILRGFHESIREP